MKKTINKDDFSTIFAEVISDLLGDVELQGEGKGMMILLVGSLFHSKLKQKLFDSNEELEIID